MSLSALLNANRIRQHTTSKQEINSLRNLVERDLHDADIPGLSADRRFATAYNAVLQLCTMALACAGYRVAMGPGHHQTTFEAARFVLDPGTSTYITYFDMCRKKRNILDYHAANVASETEAKELVTQAHLFRQVVENWIDQQYPNLRP